MLDRVIKSDGHQQNWRCVDSSVHCQFTNYELISWLFSFKFAQWNRFWQIFTPKWKSKPKSHSSNNSNGSFWNAAFKKLTIFVHTCFCCFFNDAVYCSNAKKKKQCSTILHTSTSSNETINHISASMSQLNEEVSNAPEKLEKQTRRVENDDDERRQ